MSFIKDDVTGEWYETHMTVLPGILYDDFELGLRPAAALFAENVNSEPVKRRMIGWRCWIGGHRYVL